MTNLRAEMPVAESESPVPTPKPPSPTPNGLPTDKAVLDDRPTSDPARRASTSAYSRHVYIPTSFLCEGFQTRDIPFLATRGRTTSVATHTDSGYGDAQSVISDSRAPPGEQTLGEEEEEEEATTRRPTSLPDLGHTTETTKPELPDNEHDSSEKAPFEDLGSNLYPGEEAEIENRLNSGAASASTDSLGFELVSTSSSPLPSTWLEMWYSEASVVSIRGFGPGFISEGDARGGLFRHARRLYHSLAVYGAAASGATPTPTDSGTPHMPDGQPSGQSANRGLGNGNGWNDGGLDGDDGQGGEDPDPKRRRTAGPPDGNVVDLKFACPYQKRYISDGLLCGRPHGLSKTYGWDMVSGVKQHLLRCHGKQYHCSNCWRAFSNKPNALRCHERNCLMRPPLTKPWLTDEQFLSLEKERFSNTPDAWYHIFSIVFPDLPEEGQGGYRANYTPYYCRPMSEPNTESNSPSLSRAPSSVLLTGDVSGAEYDLWNPGTSAAAGFGTLEGDPSWIGVERGDAQLLPSDIEAILRTEPAYVDPHPPSFEGEIVETTFMRGQLSDNAEISPSERPVSIATTSHNEADSASSGQVTVVMPIRHRRCSCTLSRICYCCRLRQRNSRLGSELESTRSELELTRATHTEILGMVERQDDVLQDADGGLLVADALMQKLWSYQDELRRALLPRK